MQLFVRFGRHLCTSGLAVGLFLSLPAMLAAADIELQSPTTTNLFGMSATAGVTAGGSSTGTTNLGWSSVQPPQALALDDDGTSAGVAITQVNHTAAEFTGPGSLLAKLELGFHLSAYATGRAILNSDGQVIGNVPASIAIDAKLGTKPGFATWSANSSSFLHGVSEEGATLRLVAGADSALRPGQPIWVQPLVVSLQAQGLARGTAGDASLGMSLDRRPDCQYPEKFTSSAGGLGSSDWDIETLSLNHNPLEYLPEYVASGTLLQLGDRQQTGIYRDTFKAGSWIALTVRGTSTSSDEPVAINAEFKVIQHLQVVAAMPTYRQVLGQDTPGPAVQQFAQPQDGDGGLWTTVAAMVADYWQQTRGFAPTANTPEAINELRTHLDHHGVANPLGLHITLNDYFAEHLSTDLVARKIPGWMMDGIDWDFADGPAIGVFDDGIGDQSALVVDGSSQYQGQQGSNVRFLSVKHPAGALFNPANLRTPADDVPYTGWTDERGVQWVPEESLEPTSIILTGSAQLLGRTIVTVSTGGTIEEEGLYRLSPDDPEKLGNGLGENTSGLPDTVRFDPATIEAQVEEKQELMRSQGKSDAEIALAFVTLKFYYNEQTLAVWGISEEAELRPYWWNADEERWYLGGTTIFGDMGNSLDAGVNQFVDQIGYCGINTLENYVWVNANHASEYGLIVTTIPEPTSAGLLLVTFTAGVCLRRRARMC